MHAHNDSDVEAKGSAPRVTMQDMEKDIVCEVFFTAFEGARGAPDSIKLNPSATPIPIPELDKALKVLTFCVLVLRNGFTVTGESACVSPEAFDPDIGKQLAWQKAIDKLWSLHGYALKERLFKGVS
jgi:hypothetical protein